MQHLKQISKRYYVNYDNDSNDYDDYEDYCVRRKE